MHVEPSIETSRCILAAPGNASGQSIRGAGISWAALMAPPPPRHSRPVARCRTGIARSCARVGSRSATDRRFFSHEALLIGGAPLTIGDWQHGILRAMRYATGHGSRFCSGCGKPVGAAAAVPLAGQGDTFAAADTPPTVAVVDHVVGLSETWRRRFAAIEKTGGRASDGGNCPEPGIWP